MTTATTAENFPKQGRRAKNETLYVTLFGPLDAMHGIRYEYGYYVVGVVSTVNRAYM